MIHLLKVLKFSYNNWLLNPEKMMVCIKKRQNVEDFKYERKCLSYRTQISNTVTMSISNIFYHINAYFC